MDNIIDINIPQSMKSVSFDVQPNYTVVNVNKVYGNIQSGNLQDVTDLGYTTDNPIMANAFIKSGGLSSEYLMANGESSLGITKTSQLINDGDNGISHFISLEDLPANLILYPTNVPSGIAGYSKLVNNINDPSYNTLAVAIPTGTIVSTNQFIAGLITSAGVLVGNPGQFNITTIGNIMKTSGNGDAEFYFEIWKRTNAGTEILIATSGATLPVVNSGYAEFSASALWNDGTWLSTDYVVMKFYGSHIHGGSNPSYNFQFGGSTPVRTLVPVPFTVIPNISITNLLDSNYAILTNDKIIVTSIALTLPRVVTLPLANSVNSGYELIIADFIGTVTSTNTLTISKLGSDTINGINTVVIGASYGMRRLISDGISKWSYDGGVMRISDYNFKTNQPITANINGKLTSTTTDLVNRKYGYTLSDDFVTLLSNSIWSRSTILSGTGASQPLLLDENHIGVFSFGSSVTTNSGYYIINYGSATTANLSKLIPNLQTDLIFKLPVTVNSLTTIRFGFTIGSITSTDAVSGAYFEINGNSLVGKTASASVRSSTSVTTLTADVWYHLRVTVVSTSLIKYDVYLMDGTLFSTQTLSTNIPTVALNSILIATCSDVVVSQLAIVDYIGITFPPMIRGALN